MTRRKDLLERHKHLTYQYNTVAAELAEVLSRRSEARGRGYPESEELLKQTAKLVRACLELRVRAYRLHADILEEEIKSDRKDLDSLDGLDIPTHMPPEI